MEVLLRWELELQGKSFSIRDKGFRVFQKSESLELLVVDKLDDLSSCVAKVMKRLGEEQASFFLFYNNQGSQAKSLFKHLRDAIAHGNISQMKIGRSNYLRVENHYRNNTRMVGQIKAVRMEDFIHALHGTVKL
jgi:hypothetical protein